MSSVYRVVITYKKKELDQNIGSKIETLKNDVRNMLVSKIF
jgi:hypothetical protein